MTYWVYRTKIMTWRNHYVQARLISPSPRDLVLQYGPSGYRGALQDEPYGAEISFTYQVNPKWPHPDNYYESIGFSLYSERLVALLRSFNVRAEVFPVTMIDGQGTHIPELHYYVFHNLEGVLEVMDEEQSGWTGDHDVGIPRLVLKGTGFEHRPLFKCNHIHVSLMRDDLRQEIRRQRITGFAFLAPERYRSGHYGVALAFGD